ncbi:hypothetical protein GI364_13835 [Alicyclobacillus sp. SO9]|nr:glycosyl hydrolase family 18 protein [Alicyclobacillus sp. SO9]QQE77057.1 hypothetical protein GI364_13835 [Alicyclobacillus sp. SO9]
MKLTFSYIKLVVASATALLTAAVCLFLVHLIHTQHTTHMPAPPTNDETSLHTPLLWQPWLFPRTGHASSDVSIPHIEGTSHKKKTKKKVASLPTKTSPGQGTLEHKVAAQHQSVPHSSSHNPKPNTRQPQNSAPSAKPAAKRQPEQTTPNPVRLPSIPVRTVFAYVPYYSKSISLQDIAHHSSAFTETADWSFSLEQNGSIHGMPNQSLLDYAHAHGMHVYASITNNYSSALAAHVLTSAPARARLIQQLVKLSTQYHYSGVNLDIEHITAANRGQFTAFVSNLAKALHHQGKLLTLAVPAIDAAPQERGVLTRRLIFTRNSVHPQFLNGTLQSRWLVVYSSPEYLSCLCPTSQFRGNLQNPLPREASSLYWILKTSGDAWSRNRLESSVGRVKSQRIWVPTRQ